MSKKYFNYSFQIKRTKTTGIIFLVTVVLIVTAFINWYNKRTITTKIDELEYKVSFGMNEFETRDCKKAYKMNYKKSTCGTICINQIEKNENYLKELKNEMEENKFRFNKISLIKLGNQNWEYLKTENNVPIMIYYATSTEKKTYTIEYINQSKYLSDSSKKKCNKIFNEMITSIKLND